MLYVRKIELKVNHRKNEFLSKCAGVKRVSWNWGLGEIKKALEEGRKPESIATLKKRFNQIKKELFPFVYDSPKDCNQQPFNNLKTAMSRFFSKTSKFPRFKRKKDGDSFYLSNDKTKVAQSGKSLWIPLLGWVGLKEKFPYKQDFKTNKLISVTISRQADKWFASISMEVPDEDAPKFKRTSNHILAADVGSKTKMVNSDGTEVASPRHLKKPQKRLAKKQRSVQRMRDNLKLQVEINPELNELVKTRYNFRANRNVPNSRHNLEKKNKEIQKLHATIANIRKDENHKLSNRLCRENQTIMIETLDFKEMMKQSRNHGQNRNLADNAIGQLFEFLDYKSKRYGGEIIKANKWFASSKDCSGCGNHKDDLTLTDRVYECKHCGLVVDRDLNAALNLLKYGLSYLVYFGKMSYKKANSIWLENLKKLEKNLCKDKLFLKIKNTAGLVGINAWGELTMIDISRYHSQTDLKEPGTSRTSLIRGER